jgi:hypothetical protein
MPTRSLNLARPCKPGPPQRSRLRPVPASRGLPCPTREPRGGYCSALVVGKTAFSRSGLPRARTTSPCPPKPQAGAGSVAQCRPVSPDVRPAIALGNKALGHASHKCFYFNAFSWVDGSSVLHVSRRVTPAIPLSLQHLADADRNRHKLNAVHALTWSDVV